jgi:ABC-type nitrate/sulfonate/bicarbonate transport system substrate-binding protein
MAPFLSRRTGRVLLAAAAVAVSATALSACSGASSSSSSSAAASGDYGDISVQLSWIKNEEFCGEFFADTNGYYKDAGFSGVSLVAGPSTSISELVSGSADFGLSDAVSVGTAVANEGAPVKIIGTTYQKNPFTILSRGTAGNIKTPADMKGKKIGVQDSNLALFDAFLAANGMSTSDVTIVPVQYDTSVLTNGEVDGYVAYLTNESITVASQGYTVVDLPFADNGLPFVAETLVATDEMIAQHPDEVKAFLTAEIKGWTAAVQDPQGCSDLAVKTYGADLGLVPADSLAGAKAQLSELVVSDETVKNGLFTISDALQKKTLDSLAGAGIKLTADQLFDVSLLNQVYADDPSLIAYAG